MNNLVIYFYFIDLYLLRGLIVITYFLINGKLMVALHQRSYFHARLYIY